MQFLHPYDITFPTFKTPDLTNVYQMVQHAYDNYKPGEILAQGIKGAAGAIAGGISDIPKNQQEAALNTAKVSALNRQDATTAQNTLIAGAPQAQAVAKTDSDYIAPFNHSPSSQPALPTASPTTRLAAVPADPVDLPTNSDPADVALQPDEISPDVPDEMNLNAQDFNQGRLATVAPDAVLTGSPTAIAQSRLGAVQPSQATQSRDTPKAPVNTTGTGLITAPVGITNETIPGGAVVQRLNGVPVQIKQPNETKMRAVTKSEAGALAPAGLPEKFTNAEELALMKEGIDPSSPTAKAEYLAAQKAKTASPKLDRDLQKRVNEFNITTTGKSADQVRNEVADKLAAAQQLSDVQIAHANQVATQYKTEPSYKNWTTVTDGLNNALHASTLKTGLGDKTLIEEGQRILNPNSAVAVQTMKNFGASSGLLERIMPDYLEQHFSKGAILTDNQRKEYLGILQSAMENRANEMEKTRSEYVGRLQAARIPETAAKFYVRNPYEDAVKELAATKQEISKAATPDVTAAAEWLKANPNDPKADAVRKKLEALGYKP